MRNLVLSQLFLLEVFSELLNCHLFHSLKLLIYIHFVTFIQYHVFLFGAYCQCLSSFHINPNTCAVYQSFQLTLPTPYLAHISFLS